MGLQQQTTRGNRLRRGQRLHHQRLQGKGSGRHDDKETLIVSGACTVLCAALIMALGAGLATLCFDIYQPDCIKVVNLGGTTDATPITSGEGYLVAKRADRPLLKSKSEAALTSASRAKVLVRDGNASPQELKHSAPSSSSPAEFPESAQYPPHCTSDQMDVLKQQLPAGGCERRKTTPFYRMDCSFSAATTCGDHPWWLHEFHAQHNVVLDDETAERFQAIMIGCNKAYDAVDLLRLATRDTTQRYDWHKWRAEFLKKDDPREQIDDGSLNCNRKVVEVPPFQTEQQKAQVYCIEAFPKTFKQLQKAKQSIGYIDDELDLTHLTVRLKPGLTSVYTGDPIGVGQVGPGSWRHKCAKLPDDCVEVESDKIDNWIRSKPYLADGKAPIHYMSVMVDDNAYEVLQGSAKNLARVQYLDLTYHWFGDWGRQHRSLKELMYRLKRKGFVCYFPGENDNMWRITDCWQDHYELRFVANIACVNVNIPSVQPLAERMENMFLSTLKKPFMHYGKA